MYFRYFAFIFPWKKTWHSIWTDMFSLNYTPRNELRRVWCFWPVRQLVSQSVSQSVSPVFLVSATPLKPLNRISWNVVDIKDIMCRYAYPQEILIPFFSRSYALFELRNLAKMKDTTQHSLLAQLLWNRSTEFPETL